MSPPPLEVAFRGEERAPRYDKGGARHGPASYRRSRVDLADIRRAVARRKRRSRLGAHADLNRKGLIQECDRERLRKRNAAT